MQTGVSSYSQGPAATILVEVVSLEIQSYTFANSLKLFFTHCQLINISDKPFKI